MNYFDLNLKISIYKRIRSTFYFEFEVSKNGCKLKLIFYTIFIPLTFYLKLNISSIYSYIFFWHSYLIVQREIVINSRKVTYKSLSIT